MKRFIYSAFVCLLICLPLRAVDPDSAGKAKGSFVFVADSQWVIPEQKIVGAEESVPAGDIVMLQPSSINPIPPFILGVSYNWVVVEYDFQNWKEQQYPPLREKKRVQKNSDGSIYFGAGLYENRYLAICTCTYLYKNDKNEVGQRTQNLTAEVNITGPKFPGPNPTPPVPPNPGPGPGPNPKPTPVFPDSKFKLEALAYLWAQDKIAMSASQKANVCAAVANSFEGVASAISAGTLTDVKEILQKTKDSNNNALKQCGVTDLSALDAFGTELQKQLYTMYKDKKLNLPEDYAEAWREIAYGLKVLTKSQFIPKPTVKDSND